MVKHHINIESLSNHLVHHFRRAPVLVDTAQLEHRFQALRRYRSSLEETLYRLCGVSDFRLANGSALNQVLFTDEAYLNLPTQGLPKTEFGHFSLSKDALRQWKHSDIVVDNWLLYAALGRDLKQLASLRERVNTSGRLFASYRVGETGRIISSQPNLQGLPKRSRLVPIRDLIVASPDHVILAVDYSQIELRVLAHLSGEPKLIAAFQQGRDIHCETATHLFNVDLDAVTDEMRRFAKHINFGVIFGKTAHSLADELPDALVDDGENAFRQAQAFIEQYRAELPQVRAFFDKVENQLSDTGYVETLFGYRRTFPELQQGGLQGHEVLAIRRQAKNTVIQGSAADIFKLATFQVIRRLREQGYRSRAFLPVHDELVFDVPLEELEAVTSLVVDTMENVCELHVPLKVNVEVGYNWGELRELPSTVPSA